MENNELTLDDLFSDPYDLDTPAEDVTSEEPPTKDLDEDSQDKDVEVRKAYFDFLSSSGALTLPDDFEYDGSPEQLSEALELSKTQQRVRDVQDFLESLPEDYSQALKAASQGLTLEEYYASNFQDPSTLDISSEPQQRTVVERFLKETTQFSPTKIKRLVDSYAEEGTLLEEAQDAVGELQAIYEHRLTQKQALLEQQRAEALAAQQKYTDDLVKAIDETSFIHPSRRQKVRSFFFSPIKKDNGQTTAFNLTIQNILANPSHQAQLADLLLDYSPSEGFTLERFEKRVKGKTTTLLKEEIDRALSPKSKSASPAPLKKTDSSEFLEN